MGFDMKGFEEFNSSPEELDQKTRELENNRSVPVEQVLTPDFMAKYANSASVEHFFEAGGFLVKNDEDFDALPQEPLDQYVRETSSFDSFQDMVDKAVREYIVRNLGF
ncbi:hypothetical protein [Paenibacillus lemnae]|uniref:Uncharacterized protein n=1 Tax=Paenibacillus lemnae TaxID=1330551 RepID=A0A848M7K8_PAELE|nr:hypothetical protein [Paenibacillus lemnae]NMO95544.1 hypothetical protein [Paenibacillus lemnae]